MPNDSFSKGLVPLERMFDQNDMYKGRLINDQDYEIMEFNIGSDMSPRIVKLGKGTTPTKRKKLLSLIKEFKDIFTWSYGDLKSYREDVIRHAIPLKEGEKPSRKKLRKINLKIAPQVQKELHKMVEMGIIESIKYSSWMSNPIIIQKNTDDIRLCVDFRNLNQASLKDNYPLSYMEHLLSRATEAEMMSMLDGFLGYNQVLVKKDDQLKTTFTTSCGTYTYLKMPFGLTNVGSTFHRAWTTLSGI